MMKVLHSADWHLGSSLSRADDAFHKAHSQIPYRIANLVRLHQCDLVLLSGDLFDGVPSRDTVELTKNALRAMAVPVIIAPGNHDYVSPTSPWITESFPENVHIFTNPVLESIVLPELNCRIYGAGYQGMDCPPLLRDFRADGAERFVLALLHGDPMVRNSPYCPITMEQVRESGLDYLALGHIHKSGSFRAGSTLCAWPGCPMGRGYDECGQKGVLLVSIEETAEVRFLPLEGPQFHDLTISVDGDPAVAIGSVLPPAATADYFRITLTGECPTPDISDLKLQYSRYPHLELLDRTAPPPDLWATAGTDSLEGIYFKMLQELMADNPQQQDQIRLAAKLSRQILDGREVTLP